MPMMHAIVLTLTISLINSIAMGCDISGKLFTKSEGMLHSSPHTIAQAAYLNRLECVNACAATLNCVVFSYNPASGECILYKRPDDDPTLYDIVNSAWDTYSLGCPGNKGYVQYDSHQPPLCLLFVAAAVGDQIAVNRCEQYGARLVRVKTMSVYTIVQQILINSGYTTDYIWVGADDKLVEQTFYWNDGTRLLTGTNMWRDPYTEGYSDAEDCVCVSSFHKLIDCSCGFQHAFICQYDI